MDINSTNWLSAPTNRQAFWQVDRVLSVAHIASDPGAAIPFESKPMPQAALTLSGKNGGSASIDGFLDITHADAFIVLHKGKISHEWYTPGRSSNDKHIIFSVTKSVVGSLTGILVEQGRIDPEKLVSHYVPELHGSAFGDVRVREVLDMTVSLEFEEAYLDPDSIFARYRQSTGWSGPDSDATSPGMHKVLASIPRGRDAHGSVFSYLSPNSDVLGWVCEKAAEAPLASLISDLIWKPLGAESDAYITVDRFGAPRAAGGFGCTLRDMARFGECMRNEGRLHGKQIIPKAWVDDIAAGVNHDTWERSDMADWMPGGGYRNQWWLTNNANHAYFAAGIYGQWIYVDPVHEVVIAKQSARPVAPATREEFQYELRIFQEIASSTSAYFER
ncbi:MAG: serine hydrolase domain-containing protein [Massilia sp.]